jgi:hypothetical protein
MPSVRRVKQVGPNAWIVAIPRYQQFTEIAVDLANRGARFVEIAGNDEIALTIIAPREYVDPTNPNVLFESDLLTDPTSKRVAIHTPVAALHTMLNSLAERSLKLEHIYDY